MFPPPTTIATSTPRSVTCLTARRDRGDALGIGPVREVAHERLARQLQEDPVEDRAPAVLHAYSAPTWKREKRRMTTFSPVFCETSWRSCSIVRPSCLRVHVLLVQQHGLLEPLAQLALDDLRARLLRLVGGLLLEDALLALDEVLAGPRPRRPTRGRSAAMC